VGTMIVSKRAIIFNTSKEKKGQQRKEKNFFFYLHMIGVDNERVIKNN